MKRKIFMLCSCMLLLLSSMLSVVNAAGRVDTGRDSSLTLSFRHEAQALENVAVRLYRTADISETAHFTLAGDFAEYPVQIDGLDADGWTAAASTLAAYAAADNIQPTASGTTDADGKAVFDGLRTGLYLVIADDLRIEKTVYTSAPFLVSLPNLDENDNWIYDVTALSKIEKITEPGDKIDIDVVKVWKDDGNKDKRPDKIVVSLIKDGQKVDEVVLNAANGWKYSWSELEEDHEWTVIEKEVPEDYKVTYSGTQKQFVITNTYDEPGGDIPNTGIAWWPVPLLAAAGIILFGIGWYRRYMKHDA